ncbi:MULTISPECIES: chorismate--pyruvate lyase family protein [Psychrobacter]|jgi:chorismate--pyruvate lyase|uniref:chorismate--pyruvate lyase family protein n=1 Tax=Psychrobacter TaxID=497 RepID=UPI00257EF9A4|nr:chorismate lyase [Psychrobacter sp. UBA3068]|tara:strand:- start:766 stop:1269 length:504 start_codon:yes stop_codon:yes gene_type:complete
MTHHHFSCSTHLSPPNELVSWLNAEGSLTAMLEVKAGQPLRVKRSFEGYRPLSITQKKQLGVQGTMLNRPMLAWVREVQLYGNDERPWVQAQSIFPLPSLTGRARRLQQLKGVPIGYVLFKRSRTLPNQRFIQLTADGWQRQTRYDWYGRKLLISEVFLPAFLSERA